MKWIHVTKPASEKPVGCYVASMTLMFQKEVAERITAKPHSSLWTRLSVNSQNAFTTEMGSIIRGGSFIPSAKIDAGVVRFVPRNNYQVQGVDTHVLETVCQSLFCTRRKMVRHVFHQYGAQGEAVLAASGVDGNLRAEMLSWEMWQSLCRAILDHDFLKVLKQPHEAK
eukprot:c6159_g1_i2.p1 GENE.c6159_g1_i2~~c6159_g1_i2.p1  ORF type:complete len:169 (-),score=33.19 c6159_g1_i2:4-510(-)